MLGLDIVHSLHQRSVGIKILPFNALVPVDHVTKENAGMPVITVERGCGNQVSYCVGQVFATTSTASTKQVVPCVEQLDRSVRTIQSNLDELRNVEKATR